MAKRSVTVGLVVCGLTAVVMTACEGSAVSPTQFEVVESAAFARKPGSDPGSPDKNKSCDDNENGRKTRNSPNSKNQCEGGGGGGGEGQLWVITLAGSFGGLPIDGDSIHVCGPRAGGDICLLSDADYLGSVASDDTVIENFGYREEFTIAVTESAPFVVATPYQAGSAVAGVGGGGNLEAVNYGFPDTTECVIAQTFTYFERCSSPGVKGGITYGMGPRP